MTSRSQQVGTRLSREIIEGTAGGTDTLAITLLVEFSQKVELMDRTEVRLRARGH